MMDNIIHFNFYYVETKVYNIIIFCEMYNFKLYINKIRVILKFLFGNYLILNKNFFKIFY
jgi:hypothetical protein